MNEQRRFADEGAQRMAELTGLVIDQIRQLAELHQEGVLTDEEFTAKKQELLSRL